MLRILVDFNAMTADGTRVWINTDLHEDLLDTLHSGSRVTLYEPNDIEVEAVIEIVRKEDGTERWYGIPDWSTLRDLPNDES